MDKISRRDETAKVFTDLMQSLKRMAYSILKDYSSAEDVVQDTFISVWNAVEKGNVTNIEAYTRRAVWVNSIKFRSRFKRWLSLDEENRDNVELYDFVDSFRQDLEITPWELEEGITALSPIQQTVIRLKYYSGLSFKEIGRALGISINTAASRYRYAIKDLKETFHAEGWTLKK